MSKGTSLQTRMFAQSTWSRTLADLEVLESQGLVEKMEDHLGHVERVRAKSDGKTFNGVGIQSRKEKMGASKPQSRGSEIWEKDKGRYLILSKQCLQGENKSN
jgi:hypothetical protein